MSSRASGARMWRTVGRRAGLARTGKGQPYGQIDEAKKELAALLEEQLQPQGAIVDWARKDDVQREMRRLIKRQLRAAAYPADKVDAVAESVVDLMKRRRRT
jgi:type I restriction enzyme R subunit